MSEDSTIDQLIDAGINACMLLSVLCIFIVLGLALTFLIVTPLLWLFHQLMAAQ